MSTTTKTYSDNTTKLTYRKIRSNATTITIAGIWKHSQEITLEWADFFKNYTEIQDKNEEDSVSKVEAQLLRMLLETAVESDYMYIGRDVIIEGGISEEELSEIERNINERYSEGGAR